MPLIAAFSNSIADVTALGLKTSSSYFRQSYEEWGFSVFGGPGIGPPRDCTPSTISGARELSLPTVPPFALSMTELSWAAGVPQAQRLAMGAGKARSFRRLSLSLLRAARAHHGHIYTTKLT